MKLTPMMRAKLARRANSPPPVAASPVRRAAPAARGELLRVVELPRREPPKMSDVQDLSARAGGPRGTLRPIQSLALAELKQRGGLVLPVAVGGGKTLIALLAPWCLGIPMSQVVFCVPPSLRSTFVGEAAKWCEVFEHAPSVEEVEASMIAYSELSRAEGADLLEVRAPRLIVLDEAHTVARSKSARGARFGAYMKRRPDTHLVVMSGTLLSSSLADLAALSGMALGQGSPLPLKRDDLKAWCDVTDSERGGAARAVSPHDAVWNRWGSVLPGVLDLTVRGRRRVIRAWLLDRIRCTPGVVSTTQTSAAYPCELTPLHLSVAVEVEDALKEFNATGTLPDGREVDRSVEAVGVRRGLLLGHFNHWRWEGVEDLGWLEARRAYFRELNAVVARRRPGLDSAMLVRASLEAGQNLGLDLAAAYQAWLAVEARADVESIPTILSVEPIRRLLAAWSDMRVDDSPAIIWYWSRAEAAILEALGVPVVWPGDEPPVPSRGDVAGMSIRAHGTGKQLQAWTQALVLSPPSSGKLLEQLLGRQNRGDRLDSHPGVVRVWLVDQGQLGSADKDAAFAQQTQGQEQRLLTAERKKPVRVDMS